MDIIIISNSPGELSALVSPVAKELHKDQSIRTFLVLTPCQYTSGKEIEYANSIKGFSKIISANEYKAWILKNKKPNIKFEDKGAVIYLGGDLAHAMLVAKKLKYPAFAYVQDYIGWVNFYKRFYVPDQQSFNKFKKHNKKLKIIGNLMVDSIEDIPKWSPQQNVITFMPGSRQWQIKHMTPLYAKIMDEIKKLIPNATFQLVSSPFEKAIDIKGAKNISFEQAGNSELVITIPGTNTARLAARGIPMISIFPLDNPDVIPLEGLPHFICMIPYFGSKFKSWLVNTVNKRTKFFALPNIKAQKEIVPEIRGTIIPLEIAKLCFELLNNRQKREAMSQELIRAMGSNGAAKLLVKEIYETLR